MKALVTGGSGFIATPVVKRLLEQGHEVKVLDLHKPPISHKNLEFVNKSILDEIVEDMKGCDVVFHFAAILGVENSDKKPLQTMRVNLEGSEHVFKSALEAGVQTVIYSSSSEVYGEPRELPIKEESTKGPVSAYGVSKLAAEIYAQAYTKELGADIRIVRFFNVYGPGQEPNFVIPIFLRKAKAGEPITVFGEGNQTRCFTYVEDAVDGILTVLERGKAGEAYNIGNDKPTTILELAEAIKEAAGSDSEISTVGFGENTRLKSREIEYRVPDVSKMRTLGWEPKTLIQEGISKFLQD